MLPSTLAGLVLFVTLLTPGFIYDLRADRVISRAIPSQLREVIRVVTVSLLCDVIAIALFIPVRVLLPHSTPSITAWIETGNSYWQHHARLVLPWIATYLLIACLLGYFAADKRVRKIIRIPSWLAPTDIHVQSAWYKLLHEYDDVRPLVHIYAGCQLDDGSYISGPLYSMNVKVEETADRDLILQSPLLFRAAGKATATELKGVGFTVISARNIKRLDVSHFGDESQYPQATGI